jgi:hypothetical protein
VSDSTSSTPSHGELAERFASVAERLLSTPDLPSAFAMIARIGVEQVAGAQDAGITVLRRGEFETQTATSDLPPRVDAIQYDLGSGPCVDAVLHDTTYRTGDLATDGRWPQFGSRAAAETGVHSMLAFRLFCEDEDVQAALNLYCTRRDAFDENAVSVGLVLASHAGLSLAAAGRRERIVSLQEAVADDRDIGVAIGMVMTKHLVTQQQAFDLLQMASQRTHRRLHDIAIDVIESGELKLP